MTSVGEPHRVGEKEAEAFPKPVKNRSAAKASKVSRDTQSNPAPPGQPFWPPPPRLPPGAQAAVYAQYLKAYASYLEVCTKISVEITRTARAKAYVSAPAPQPVGTATPPPNRPSESVKAKPKGESKGSKPKPKRAEGGESKSQGPSRRKVRKLGNALAELLVGAKVGDTQVPLTKTGMAMFRAKAVMCYPILRAFPEKNVDTALEAFADLRRSYRRNEASNASFRVAVGKLVPIVRTNRIGSFLLNGAEEDVTNTLEENMLGLFIRLHEGWGKKPSGSLAGLKPGWSKDRIRI